MLAERSEQLEAQLKAERQMREDDRNSHHEELGKVREAMELERARYMREIAELNRLIGRLEGRLENKDKDS